MYIHVHEGWERQKNILGGKAYFQEIGTLTLLKPSQCYKAYLYSQLCRRGRTGGRHCCRGGIWSCWWPAQWTLPDARSEACWVPWWCEESPGQHLWSGVSALSQALATHEALPLPHPKNGYCVFINRVRTYWMAQFELTGSTFIWRSAVSRICLSIMPITLTRLSTETWNKDW